MADLAVIVPSRGRPARLAELVAAIDATAAGPVRVVACVDDDDPTREEYERLAQPGVDVWSGPRRTLSGWTNYAAALLLAEDVPPRHLASLGDDHRPRTTGWDARLVGAIGSLGGAAGIAYGDDLYQGPRLPTAWAMSAAVVRAIGWMMLPTCAHMYVDTAILALGQATGRILYCPDVTIEHLHPAAGKGDWDDSYRESNAPERYAADLAAFSAWRDGGGLVRDALELVAA